MRRVVLGHAITTCDNTAHAVDVWHKYNWLFFGSFFDSTERITDDIVTYEFAPRVNLLPHLLQFFLEEKLVIEGKPFRKFNNCTIRIRSFSTTYAPPPHADRYYAVLPPGGVHFNAPKILFMQDSDEAYETKPFEGADPESHEVCVKYLNEISSAFYSRTSFSAKILYLFDKHFPYLLSLDDMAELLNTSRRTLCRNLSKEKTTYQNLLSEIREETAKNLLATTRMSVDEISSYLGFENSASFRRAFKQWTGETIGDYKNNSRSLYL
jgi:AraC-like DNA-binding protein